MEDEFTYEHRSYTATSYTQRFARCSLRFGSGYCQHQFCEIGDNEYGPSLYNFIFNHVQVFTLVERKFLFSNSTCFSCFLVFDQLLLDR